MTAADQPLRPVELLGELGRSQLDEAALRNRLILAFTQRQPGDCSLGRFNDHEASRSARPATGPSTIAVATARLSLTIGFAVIRSRSPLAAPEHDDGLLGRARSALDNPDHLIRPEAVAAAVDAHAADDAIFTSDTGMSTVWLSRFVTMRGTRRLVGSYNLGSMANAMPQALGAQALDRRRQVVAFCGDGGLTMLLGDLLTAVAYDLPVTFVVFNNGRLGMVKLEQEQGGLPEFGTKLRNPDLAAVARAMGLGGIRATDPRELDRAVLEALSSERPVVLDVLTNPDEVALPPKLTAGDAWGFAIAKLKEAVASRGDDR